MPENDSLSHAPSSRPGAPKFLDYWLREAVVAVRIMNRDRTLFHVFNLGHVKQPSGEWAELECLIMVVPKGSSEKLIGPFMASKPLDTSAAQDARPAGGPEDAA